MSNFKLPKKCKLCELNEILDESTILRGGTENDRASENIGRGVVRFITSCFIHFT